MSNSQTLLHRPATASRGRKTATEADGYRYVPVQADERTQVFRCIHPAWHENASQDYFVTITDGGAFEQCTCTDYQTRKRLCKHGGAVLGIARVAAISASNLLRPVLGDADYHVAELDSIDAVNGYLNTMRGWTLANPITPVVHMNGTTYLVTMRKGGE